MKLKQRLKKVDNFIANVVFAKRTEKLLYLGWLFLALYLINKILNKAPLLVIVGVTIVGWIFLYFAISGIRDKKLSSQLVWDTKNQAIIGGYINLIIFIGFILWLILLGWY